MENALFGELMSEASPVKSVEVITEPELTKKPVVSTERSQRPAVNPRKRKLMEEDPEPIVTTTEDDLLKSLIEPREIFAPTPDVYITPIRQSEEDLEGMEDSIKSKVTLEQSRDALELALKEGKGPTLDMSFLKNSNPNKTPIKPVSIRDINGLIQAGYQDTFSTLSTPDNMDNLFLSTKKMSSTKLIKVALSEVTDIVVLIVKNLIDLPTFLSVMKSRPIIWPTPEVFNLQDKHNEKGLNNMIFDYDGVGLKDTGDPFTSVLRAAAICLNYQKGDVRVPILLPLLVDTKLGDNNFDMPMVDSELKAWPNYRNRYQMFDRSIAAFTYARNMFITTMRTRFKVMMDSCFFSLVTNYYGSKSPYHQVWRMVQGMKIREEFNVQAVAVSLEDDFLAVEEDESTIYKLLDTIVPIAPPSDEVDLLDKPMDKAYDGTYLSSMGVPERYWTIHNNKAMSGFPYIKNATTSNYSKIKTWPADKLMMKQMISSFKSCIIDAKLDQSRYGQWLVRYSHIFLKAAICKMEIYPFNKTNRTVWAECSYAAYIAMIFFQPVLNNLMCFLDSDNINSAYTGGNIIFHNKYKLLIKKMLNVAKARGRCVTVYSDNMTVVERKKDGSYDWISLDGKKMEYVINPKFCRQCIEYAITRFWTYGDIKRIDSTILQFMCYIYPWIACGPNNLQGVTFWNEHMKSGTVATPYFNTIKSALAALMFYTVDPGESIFTDDYTAFKPVVLDGLKALGLCLSIESVEVDILKVLEKPSPLRSYLKLDQLGFDYAYNDDSKVKAWMPVLNIERSYRSLCFNKRKINYDNLVDLVYLFVKYYTAYIQSWFIPGIRMFTRSLMSKVKTKINKLVEMANKGKPTDERVSVAKILQSIKADPELYHESSESDAVMQESLLSAVISLELPNNETLKGLYKTEINEKYHYNFSSVTVSKFYADRKHLDILMKDSLKVVQCGQFISKVEERFHPYSLPNLGLDDFRPFKVMYNPDKSISNPFVFYNLDPSTMYKRYGDDSVPMKELMTRSVLKGRHKSLTEVTPLKKKFISSFVRDTIHGDTVLISDIKKILADSRTDDIDVSLIDVKFPLDEMDMPSRTVLNQVNKIRGKDITSEDFNSIILGEWIHKGFTGKLNSQLLISLMKTNPKFREYVRLEQPGIFKLFKADNLVEVVNSYYEIFTASNPDRINNLDSKSVNWPDDLKPIISSLRNAWKRSESDYSSMIEAPRVEDPQLFMKAMVEESLSEDEDF